MYRHFLLFMSVFFISNFVVAGELEDHLSAYRNGVNQVIEDVQLGNIDVDKMIKINQDLIHHGVWFCE